MSLAGVREICGDLRAAESLEWLFTNGLGGFGSGTMLAILTRRYHGLLVAAVKPPLGRTLLIAKVDEQLEYAGRSRQLFATRVARWHHRPARLRGPRGVPARQDDPRLDVRLSSRTSSAGTGWGTRYGICSDPADGLLRAGEPGVQLTCRARRAETDARGHPEAQGSRSEGG